MAVHCNYFVIKFKHEIMSGIMWNIMIGVNSREVDLYEQIELIKDRPQN